MLAYIKTYTKQFKFYACIFVIIAFSKSVSAQTDTTNNHDRQDSGLIAKPILKISNFQKPEIKNDSQINIIPTNQLDGIKNKKGNPFPDLSDSVNKENVADESVKKIIPSIKKPSIKDICQCENPIDTPAKSKFKKVMDQVKLSGPISLEYYNSNYVLPYSGNQNTYMRLSGAPEVSIMGLPFTMNFFVTNEDNSFYNSNSFSFSFDKDKFRNKTQEKKNSEKQKLNGCIDKVKNLKNGKLIENQKNLFQLNQLKKQNSLLKDSLSFELIAAGLNDSLKLPTITFDTSSINLPDTNLSDSLKQIQAKIERLKQLSNGLQKIEKIIQMNDSLISYYNNLEKELNSIIGSKFKDSLTFDKSNIQDKFPKLERLNIGIVYPDVSDFVFSNIIIKGGQMDVSYKKNVFGTVLGRTFKTEYNTFGLNQPKPKFDRDVKLFYIGRNLNSKSQIRYYTSSISDPEKTSIEPKKNILNGLNGNFSLLDFINIKGEIVHSSFQENTLLEENYNYTSAKNVYYKSEPAKILNNVAYDLQSEISLLRNLKLEANYRQINPGFVTLGNPFLRKNYKEYEGQVKTDLFKKKLTIKTFYKQFTDNLFKLESHTNKMEGFGINARTKFRKLPNIMFLYSPYQQSNNHPDSLLKTRNQFAVTNVTLTYQFKIHKIQFQLMSGYVNSHVSNFINGQTSKNEIYNVNFMASSKNVMVSLNGVRNYNHSAYNDTMNYYDGGLNITQIGGSKILFSGEIRCTFYDIGSFRAISALGVTFKLLKNMAITNRFEYGKINKLFGLENKNIYSYTMKLGYNF